MKTRFVALVIAIQTLSFSLWANTFNEPDSAYLFAYSTTKNHGNNGLHYAWSTDGQTWQSIGPEHRFLFCDYGAWGAQKKMFTPFLFQDQQGIWRCIWTVNDQDGVFAHAPTDNLMDWSPQSYPAVMENGNCLSPEVSFLPNHEVYQITWISKNDETESIYGTTTKDFKSYSETKKLDESARLQLRKKVTIDGAEQIGTKHRVAWSEIQQLINRWKLDKHNEELKNESYWSDPQLFRELKPVEATITASIQDSKSISDMLMGVFFEDINYAADGGLYAELIQNRGFEYKVSDTKGNNPNWTATKAWSLVDSTGSMTIETQDPIHPNNPHYALLNVSEVGEGLANEGFDGIPVKAGDKYDFSVFVKNLEVEKQKILVRLVDEKGNTIGESSINTKGKEWKKLSTTVTAHETSAKAQLQLISTQPGKVALDMISLFPQNTYKGRENGLRPDLAEAIADLNPQFLRFPGGCVAHGDGIENIYKWKNTIGPLESRIPDMNIWRYHQSMGLGFFEYFQFCEDLGAEPIPVIAAGVPCQNSSIGGAGQQGGIPLGEMDAYIQDILDLIEYANGSTKSEWGKKRAEAGHPKPFDLKYIGIGNEDLITDIFEERFKMIYDAINAKYPEIVVIGTVGPFHDGSDYRAGWELASELDIPIVDEHYYEQPGWFINNQDFYDRYDRSKAEVYLGEYASWDNRLYNALAEAIYLTGIERNADVVKMASYAPLLAKHDHTQWRTDMVFFDNTQFYPTPNYHVQRLYGQHIGDQYINSEIQLSDSNPKVNKRVGASIVRDSNSGDVIVKLVNVLPVEVNSDLDISGLDLAGAEADKYLLTGKPESREADVLNETIKITEDWKVKLPPYSLTVIRIKN